MTAASVVLFVVFAALLVALAWPLGGYMARVFRGEARLAGRILGPVERVFYRLAGVRTDDDMTWKRYAVAIVVFNAVGALVVYGLQRLQGSLPANPLALAGVDPRVAFNTAVSFVSNTNWQTYGGETTMSFLVQMLALAVQNFLSAATGIAVLVALVRGFTGKRADGIGNAWVDLTRATLYVLLPLSLVLALALVSQGVPQTLDGSATAALVEPVTATDGTVTADQTIALGPVASQIAIKHLGTNGGGFYNVNSAHPLENPNPVSNLLQMLAQLLIPVALCFALGTMVGSRRQGIAILVAMVVIFVPLWAVCTWAEQGGNPALTALGVDQAHGPMQAGGNMEGKEVRFGIAASTLFATTTTAASCGAVNSMHDSYTPLGGLVPMWLIQLGEVVFGGVGSGLYGMMLFAIVAMFLAGLMVGRTPELLGKKLEAYDIKMAVLGILVPSACVLVATAIACLTGDGADPGIVPNPGAHGFSELLYAFSSGSNNNGSAFGGLTASGTFFATAVGIVMWIGRFFVIIPVLAIAGSLAGKKTIPVTSGTLPTDGGLFVALLVGTVILVGALTFIPALALGPIVEHLQLVP